MAKQIVNLRRALFEDTNNRGKVTGYENYAVEVDVDFAKIAREMGRSAATNKSGSSKALKGAVVVRTIGGRTKAVV